LSPSPRCLGRLVIIENDPERCAWLSDQYIATIIEGDATHPDIFRQANLGDADTVTPDRYSVRRQPIGFSGRDSVT